MGPALLTLASASSAAFASASAAFFRAKVSSASCTKPAHNQTHSYVRERGRVDLKA